MSDTKKITLKQAKPNQADLVADDEFDLDAFMRLSLANQEKEFTAGNGVFCRRKKTADQTPG